MKIAFRISGFCGTAFGRLALRLRKGFRSVLICDQDVDQTSTQRAQDSRHFLNASRDADNSPAGTKFNQVNSDYSLHQWGLDGLTVSVKEAEAYIPDGPRSLKLGALIPRKDVAAHSQHF
jgi:hypothetical protein